MHNAYQQKGRGRYVPCNHAAMKPSTSLTDTGSALTQATVEKLKRAIHFIGENYASDISREGLAALVGMHPDSLSRFFNIYTEKRIKEFINGYRIREAAEFLRSSDEMITVIAQKVGFESLSTFNRAFLKEMKISPSAYRNSVSCKKENSVNKE